MKNKKNYSGKFFLYFFQNIPKFFEIFFKILRYSSQIFLKYFSKFCEIILEILRDNLENFFFLIFKIIFKNSGNISRNSS